MTQTRRFSAIFFFGLCLIISSLLTGCTLATTAPDAIIAGPAMHGSVYGGQQQVVGAHVYLMAATVSGVGSAGYGLASTSLLKSSVTGLSDSVGAYVLTDSTGTFRLDAGAGSSTYDYTCPSTTTQVYLYVLGGNPGTGTNSAASFMAALGSCGSLSSATNVFVNEISTVAAAYALSGFATDALHMSIPQYATTAAQTANTVDTLAQTDLQNAFAGVTNLVNVGTGAALTTTPGGNGTPQTSQVITLANILGACINSNGTTTNPSNCFTLFNNAGSSGGSTGTIPTNTATAAINIAHHPFVSTAVMTALYALQPGTGAPFTGGDSTQPADWTISVAYTGGGLTNILAQVHGLAFDASGNAWIAAASGTVLSEFSPLGAPMSTTGFAIGGSEPFSTAVDATSTHVWMANDTAASVVRFTIAGATANTFSLPHDENLDLELDGSGNAFVASFRNPASIFKLNSSGTLVGTFTDANQFHPNSLALGAGTAGNVWAADLSAGFVNIFTNSGTLVANDSAGNVNLPWAVAIDANGFAWVTNIGASSVSKLASSGTTGTSFNLSGTLNAVAIDGGDNVWAGSSGGLFALSNAGTLLSGSSGYSGNASGPLAIDGAGNVWYGSANSAVLHEVIGVAVPVVTPIAYGVANSMLGTRP